MENKSLIKTNDFAVNNNNNVIYIKVDYILDENKIISAKMDMNKFIFDKNEKNTFEKRGWIHNRNFDISQDFLKDYTTLNKLVDDLLEAESKVPEFNLIDVLGLHE